MKINKIAAALTAMVISAVPAMNASAYGEKGTKAEPMIMDFNSNDVNGTLSLFLPDGLVAHVRVTFDSPEGKDITYYDYNIDKEGQYIFDIEGRDNEPDDYRLYRMSVDFTDSDDFTTPEYTDTFYVYENSEPVIYEYSFVQFDASTTDVFTVTGESGPDGEITMHRDIAVNMNAMLKGDVNFDGKITAIDASAVLVEYAEVTSGGGSFSDTQKKVGDVNNDGKITATDATSILRYYTALSAGLTPSWD